MSPNFPTRNAYQTTWNCGVAFGDAFVAKLGPDGSRLDYATYLGGCNGFLGDAGRGIAVDSQGRAVVAGDTDSFEFPTTPGAADRTCAQPGGFCDDVFVARLSAGGSALEYSTLFGGDDSQEHVRGLALDAQDRPVIAGYANGFGTDDFPGTPGSYEPADRTGFDEVFAARLSADGSALHWATGFGGSDHEQATALALDGTGDVHLTGTTESDDFPTTPGAFDRVCNVFYEPYTCTNHSDAFALELSADGSQLLSSTFYGGGGTEKGGDIAIDGAGRAYLTGTTASTASTLPMVDPFQADPPQPRRLVRQPLGLQRRVLRAARRGEVGRARQLVPRGPQPRHGARARAGGVRRLGRGRDVVEGPGDDAGDAAGRRPGRELRLLPRLARVPPVRGRVRRPDRPAGAAASTAAASATSAASSAAATSAAATASATATAAATAAAASAASATSAATCPAAARTASAGAASAPPAPPPPAAPDGSHAWVRLGRCDLAGASRPPHRRLAGRRGHRPPARPRRVRAAGPRAARAQPRRPLAARGRDPDRARRHVPPDRAPPGRPLPRCARRAETAAEERRAA